MPPLFACARRSCRCQLAACLCLLLVLCCASSSPAQTCVDPRTLAFTASPDHDALLADGQPVVTSYEVDLFRSGGTSPIGLFDIGKPAPAPDGTISLDLARLLDVPAIPGMLLELRVVAIGPGGRSESVPSNPFIFSSPGANAAPVVSLTNPASGAAFAEPASITISVSANDSDGAISGVRLYALGALIGVLTSSPYVITWRNVPAGTYTITAVATDNRGAQTTSVPVQVTVVHGAAGAVASLPRLIVTSPADGTTVAAGSQVRLSAAFAIGESAGSGTRSRAPGTTVWNVRFYANGELVGAITTGRWTMTWTVPSPGIYEIVAVASSGWQDVRSSPVRLTVR